jgi:hypothetical protein
METLEYCCGLSRDIPFPRKRCDEVLSSSVPARIDIFLMSRLNGRKLRSLGPRCTQASDAPNVWNESLRYRSPSGDTYPGRTPCSFLASGIGVSARTLVRRSESGRSHSRRIRSLTSQVRYCEEEGCCGHKTLGPSQTLFAAQCNLRATRLGGLAQTQFSWSFYNSRRVLGNLYRNLISYPPRI